MILADSERARNDWILLTNGQIGNFFLFKINKPSWQVIKKTENLKYKKKIMLVNLRANLWSKEKIIFLLQIFRKTDRILLVGTYEPYELSAIIIKYYSLLLRCLKKKERRLSNVPVKVTKYTKPSFCSMQECWAGSASELCRRKGTREE
jgi:hypothetical protein